MGHFEPSQSIISKGLVNTYFEQSIVPLASNITKQVTPVKTTHEFIAPSTRHAEGLLTTDDNKIQKVFMHIIGVAANTYTYGNGLDCSTVTDNQWQLNLNGGSWSDLVNGTNPDGQMNDNDWRCPLQGSIAPFHLMFDVTNQITDIDGDIGLRLENGISQQEDLYVTISVFLRVMYYK